MLKKHLINLLMAIIGTTVICSHLHCVVNFIDICIDNTLPYYNISIALYAIISSIMLSILGIHKILDLLKL